jgi:hypothetical protein
MAAALKNIVIERRATFSLHFLVQNGSDQSAFDLTGYTATAQVRETAGAKHIVATFTCAIPNPSGGEMTAVLSNTVTTNLKPGIYFWDLYITTSGAAIRLLQGKATVTDTVTHP